MAAETPALYDTEPSGKYGKEYLDALAVQIGIKDQFALLQNPSSVDDFSQLRALGIVNKKSASAYLPTF
jgi:hypothetical protein